MSISAGIEFNADEETAEKMRAAIPALDAVVNDDGLGVSCTPRISMYMYDGVYCISGQTHWSHDGKNGRVLNAAIKEWIEANKFDVEIVGEYDA